MGAFPDTVHFRGLNRPVRVEGEVNFLEIEGTLPPEISGAFFRALPDRQLPPMVGDRDVILSHDGLIAKLDISDGCASYAVRFVRTDRFLAERHAGRALFGHYRQPYTDDPLVAGVDRTLANTTPIWHAGRLFIVKEDGLAHQIDPHTLKTLGKWDFDGLLRSETMTAHPRIDPQSGELLFFGYEAAGLSTKTIAYCIVNREGKLISEEWFDGPYCSMMHDFAVTENYAVFPVFPTTSDLERVKAGGPHWIHEQDRESWIGIMPRYGKGEDVRWFRGPNGVHSYHILNAYEDGDRIHLDMCMFNTNMIPFVREDTPGLDIQPDGSLARWTMDLSAQESVVATRDIGPLGEMPRTRDIDQGRPYSHGWYLTLNPAAGPLLAAGPAGVSFNVLLRIQPDNGGIEDYTFPAYHAVSEPVHIPANDPGHGGYLMMFVDIDHAKGGENYQQEVWIMEADNIARGAIAKIRVPLPSRPQVHGCWVPSTSLAKAKIAPPVEEYY